jgi:hypothetical protein
MYFVDNHSFNIIFFFFFRSFAPWFLFGNLHILVSDQPTGKQNNKEKGNILINEWKKNEGKTSFVRMNLFSKEEFFMTLFWVTLNVLTIQLKKKTITSLCHYSIGT